MSVSPGSHTAASEIAPAIRYVLAATDPHAHLFEVTCTVADPDPGGQVFRLPAWTPGSYLVREFARHFVTVRAHGGDTPLQVEKIAKDTWRVAACDGPVSLVAAVYAFDLSVRAAYLDASRGFVNGASMFVTASGKEERPCELDIRASADGFAKDWQVATTMTPVDTNDRGFGLYRAADYDELIDHPVEMAALDCVTFEAGGTRHEIAVTGRHDGDLSRLARDLGRICQAHIDLFGGQPASRPPFQRYLFQILVLGDAYGGLEHRTSTSLVCKRDNLPDEASGSVSDDYRTLLGLASHEYFHAWNVKRIKPAAFTPYDLSRENYTRQLWAFEGITSYYDDLLVLRSGVIDIESYLELLGRSISALQRNPGAAVQSIAESSFDAWIKYYRQDENAPNAIVSYYLKGSLVALMLDLKLRSESTATLDDIMRALWERYGKTGVGVPEDGVQAIAEELSQLPLDDFFQRYVHGTDPLPLEAMLARIGLRLRYRQAQTDNDKGGSAGKTSSPERCWFGVTTTEGSDLKVRHVYAGGPAMKAGLASGDSVIAIDGLRATSALLQSVLQKRKPREAVRLHVFRRDELHVFDVPLESAPLDRCWLEIDEDAAAEARVRRDAWVAG